MIAMGDSESIRPLPVSRRKRKELRTPNPEVRSRLLAAANELIRKEGVPNLRIDEVAENAGLSVGTFYLYFEGKDDLFTSLVVDHNHDLLTRLQESQAGGGCVAERLLRRMNAYLDFTEENEKLYLYYRSAGSMQTTEGDLQQWLFRLNANDLQPTLEEGIKNGEIRPQDAELLAQALVGLHYHMVGFWLENKESVSRDYLRTFMMEMLRTQFLL